MMQIVYFSQKEQFLSEMENLQGEKIYVTPSPAKADGLRARLRHQGSQDVITIAKFTSNLVSALWEGEDKPQVKRKAELLLIFGILKNKYLPELGYEQFAQAYNLFSDLRSFTLDQDALSAVLDEQAEEVKKAVQLFWTLLSATGFLDEHGAYREITEKIRSSEEKEELKRIYIFWGFQHLNGQQVDLLKALSIRYQVVVPFPYDLKDKIKRSDWISWLKDSRTDEVILPVQENVPRASWISINSREIARHLKEYLKSGDQVVLGVSKLSPLHLDTVPSLDVNYKIPLVILSHELKEVSFTLKRFQGSHVDLAQFCQEKMKLSKNMKLFKTWQLYHEALQFIAELTDEIVPVDHFFLKVLDEVAHLNQPRTSFVPSRTGTSTIDFKDMSSLEDVDPKRRVLLCIDERFDDVQGLGQNYTETIQKALSSMGPLKRNELELLFRQKEFRDLFSRADVTVFMNEGTLKHSLVWKRLFTDIELVKVEKNIPEVERKLKDHFRELEKKTFSGPFSASKLQTFMDCPRKFYFNFVDAVFPDVLLEKDFDPMTSGTIIHEIIERFFKESLKEEDLKSLIKEVMEKAIKEKKLMLPEEVYLQRELIFNHRSMNGIQFIRQIEKMSGENIQWKIEEDFKLNEDFAINGRIDCMGVGNNTLFLLDFKSTEASAATGSDVEEIEAIQLWAYAYASKKLVRNFDQYSVVLGYVVLDDPSKSVLVTSDTEIHAKFKEAKICRLTKLKDDFSVKLKEAEEKMVSLTLAIASEKDFPARPRDNGACSYCELNKVCVKSELSHV